MLQQEAMIERVGQICRADERLAAAMMYGSFAQDEGDEYSDIEFILFFEDDALETLDQEEWVSRIAPVELYFVNEYGIGAAIFENLVRGEFPALGERHGVIPPAMLLENLDRRFVVSLARQETR